VITSVATAADWVVVKSDRVDNETHMNTGREVTSTAAKHSDTNGGRNLYWEFGDSSLASRDHFRLLWTERLHVCDFGCLG
jgi:hypothetical protein